VLDKGRQFAPGLRATEACNGHVVPGNLGRSPDLPTVVLDRRTVAHIRSVKCAPGRVTRLSSPGRRRVRVLDVVPTEDDSDRYVGLLRVETA